MGNCCITLVFPWPHSLRSAVPASFAKARVCVHRHGGQQKQGAQAEEKPFGAGYTRKQA